MKLVKQVCDLESCQFCKLCLKEWLPTIGSNRKTLLFKKGETIFNEGEEVTGMYFLLSGTVKMFKKWGGDKELIVRFSKKGDIFGHRGIGDNTTYPISAMALEPLTVCFIAMDFFIASLKINNDYSLQLLRYLATELEESETNMRNLAHMSVKGRVAFTLLKLENQFGKTEKGYINIQISRQDIASYAGTTYETVFRTMDFFVKNDLIESNGRKITIKKHKLLLELTKEPNETIISRATI